MSGAPMVQHSLNCMLEFYKQELISLENSWKMCHNPAILYRMTNRGFIREGYFADLTLVDLNSQWTVARKTSCTNVVGHHWRHHFTTKVIQTL
jgi:dihydroorotase